MVLKVLTQDDLYDQDNLARLLLEHKHEYYRIAYSFTGNEANALDAVSDMITIVLRKIHQLKKADSFYSWTRTILVNQCRQMLKKQKHTINLDNDVIETLLHDDEQENRIEMHHDIQLVIKQLSVKHQEVIIMKYFLNMQIKEIAESLHIKEGTVKSRLSIGLRKLEKTLGGVYNGKNC